MGILRKLRLRGDRGKNKSATKPPEAYAGVSVGCGGGNVTLPPATMPSSPSSRDNLYRELASYSGESASSNDDELIDFQTQRSPLSRVSEESSSPVPMALPDSPLSTGPPPSKTPPKAMLQGLTLPRYSDDLANRIPMIRGQRVAERTALFENSPVKNRLSLGRESSNSAATATFDLCMLHDTGSQQDDKPDLDESGSTSSSSMERNTPASIKRGAVGRKKKWLEQAFTPTGGGNMRQSEDEDENKSPHSSAPDFSFDITPPPPSRKSLPSDVHSNQSLSANKTTISSPSSIFRPQTPVKSTLKERQAFSPKMRDGPMDVTQAYRVWHAKGLLAFQPEKPRHKSFTATNHTTGTTAAAENVALEAECSYRYSDLISGGPTESGARKDAHAVFAVSSPRYIRTTNGKLVRLDTVSHDDEEVEDDVELHEPAFVVSNPFDQPVEDDVRRVPLVAGAVLLLTQTESRRCSMARSNAAPILTLFGGRHFMLYRSPASIHAKRISSFRKHLPTPNSPRSVAAKSRMTSLDRSKQAFELDELALTIFGGFKYAQAGTHEEVELITSLRPEVAAEVSNENAGAATGQKVKLHEDAISTIPIAVTELQETLFTVPPSIYVSPRSASRNSFEFSKQRTKDAISKGVLMLSGSILASTVTKANVTVLEETPTNVNARPSNRAEAYANYVKAFKTYKKDRKSVENLERSKDALQLTKSPALARPQPQKALSDEPILLSLFTGAAMETPPKSEGRSKRVKVYTNHVLALKRRSAKKKLARSQVE